MPPLGNKFASLTANEKTSTPNVPPPEPPKKQRDMSRSLPKHQNPDLGAQPSKGAVLPALPAPGGPPVPALAPYGVMMPMHQVNSHVDQIAAAHKQQFGYDPSPGLVFDLLKNQSIVGPNADYNKLFATVTKRDQVAQQVGMQPHDQPLDSNYLYVRQDGLVVKPIPKEFGNTLTLSELHKQYPTVQMGMIPLPNADSIYKAVGDMFNTPDELKVADMGETPQEAVRKAEYASGGATQDAFYKAMKARRDVTTVVQAQVKMNAMMGTQLPTTGVFNTDWQRAWSDYTKTKDYFKRSQDFQAQQHGMSSAAFVKAFVTKANVVHKHGAFQYFTNALPVQVFAHGGSPFDIFKGIVTVPFHDPSLSVSYPFNVLTRVGGEAFHMVGGTIEQAKADGAGANAFMNYATDHGGVVGHPKTYDEAKAKMKEALNKNPSWVRLFYPDLPENGPGWEKALVTATDFAGDLILLRKANFTGETIADGDLSAATRSGGLKMRSRYAYAYMQQGKLGRAVSMLEGGAGATKLVASAARAVEKGRMTVEQFNQHVAELYANGRTVISIPPKENPNLIDVYHGTGVLDPLDAAAGANENRFGHTIFVTPSEAKGSHYATLHEGEGETPNVRLHRVDASRLFTYSKHPLPVATPEEAAGEAAAKGRVANFMNWEGTGAAASELGGAVKGIPSDVAKTTKEIFKSPVEELKAGETAAAKPEKVATPRPVEPRLIKRVLGKLTPEETEFGKTLESVKVEDIKTTKDLYDYLSVMGSAMEHDGLIAKTNTYGKDFANEVLQRAGFQGIQDGVGTSRLDHEIAIFNPEKHLLPRFEKPVEVPVTGPLLSSMRSTKIITPSKTTVAARAAVRDKIDEFDAALRLGGKPGTAAADFTSWLRSSFAHAAPRSPRAYFDPKLTERVHDFTLRHFGDAKLANDMENALIKAQAAGNVPKIQKIENQLQRMYFRKYSIGKGAPLEDDPFTPLLSTEAGSRFHFPAGNRRPVENPFDAIAVSAREVSAALAKVAAVHRRLLILSPSLFWKHAVGDTARRIVGGDVPLRGAFGEVKAARQRIITIVNADKELARRWGVFLDRTKNGEAYYMAKPGERTINFNTGDEFGSGVHMEAAGAVLRRLLDDPAHDAYMKSTSTDLKPIIDMVKNDPVYRRLWSARQRKRAIEKYGKEPMQQGFRIQNFQHGIFQSRQEMMRDAYSAEDMAADIFNRYKAVEDSAKEAGTSLMDARSVLTENRGNADHALGSWIKDNKVDFNISHALVAKSTFGSFDALSSKMVGLIMTPNKANRLGFAENIAASTFAHLVNAGWDEKTALHSAMDVAEKQVVYHMLDFSNMLQVEQDLRWLAYFSTKHRLYWKWVASTMVRHPGVPALLSDVQQHLDPQGNYAFHIDGHRFGIPVHSLVWIQNKEYPSESPFFTGLAGFLKNGFSLQEGVKAAAGSSGTGINRNSSGLSLFTNLVKMETGHMPATYTNALSGLSPSDQLYLKREMNHYNSDYFNQHGHYAPQAEVVKHSLLALGFSSFWRANKPIPLIPLTNPNDVQKLIDQAMKITDPQKRSKFFADHPEVTATFGISKDPRTYQQNRKYFGLYAQARAQYQQGREEIYQDAVKQGHMTIQMEEQRRKLSDEFSKVFDRLKKQDLAESGGPGAPGTMEVNGEWLGRWGLSIAGDTMLSPLSQINTIFPNLPKKDITAALPGTVVKNAEQELKLLQDPEWVAKTFADPSEARTRQRELLQVIQDFRAYPHDALGRVQATYQDKFVNKYWKHVTDANVQIAKLGRGAKDLAYANLRQWKDEQDHPVKINGIEFPSPIKMAWADMPPDVREQRIAALATGSWDHLADYEKTLLGLKPASGTSEGWDALLAAKKRYTHEQVSKGLSGSLQAGQIMAAVKGIDKQRPGFLKDWQFAHKPSIYRFEKTALYKEMPKQVKEWWDENVSPNANAIAGALRDPNRESSSKAQVKLAWEDAVTKQFVPEIESDPVLKRWFTPYLTANPDWLNSLVK